MTTRADQIVGTTSASAAAPLVDATGFLLRRAHTLFALHWQLCFNHPNMPLTPVQGGILVSLAEQSGLTQAELARQLGVEAPTVQAALDRLAALGCLTRERARTDGRTNTLVLTEHGRAALDAVRRFGQEREAALLGPLSDDERNHLRDLLSRLVVHGQALVRGLQER